MRSVSELVAGTAEQVEGLKRPGFIRVFVLTWVACSLGLLAAMIVSALVSLTGVGMPSDWGDEVPYLATALGPIVADALSVLFFSAFAILLTRVVLSGWLAAEHEPAWTWIAVAIVPTAALVVLSPATTVNGGLAIAGVAIRYAAWDAEGRPRREPFLTPRSARWVVPLVPAVLLAGIAGYALLHPLTTNATDMRMIARGTSPVLVNAPTIHNRSGRRIRILSIEPGRERGYALHLIGVRAYTLGARPSGAASTHPVSSFVLAAHGESPWLLLQLSRAGCRPGTSGRIETIRVRYRLGGDRVMELPVKPAATLSC